MFICFHATCADFYSATAHELWKSDPLEIGIFALVSRGVEFGCTNAVRIATSDLGSLITCDADIRCCHMIFHPIHFGGHLGFVFRMLSCVYFLCKIPIQYSLFFK